MSKDRGHCPKCKSHAVTTKYLSYTNTSNVCMVCGCSHTIGSSRESLDRQVKGDNWRNPRTENPIKGSAGPGPFNNGTGIPRGKENYKNKKGVV